MWYVPVRLRGKLDARWRYGLFLGRATDSDQNTIALKNGNIVRARAMIRVVEDARWSMDRINAIQMSPTQERAHGSRLDDIEIHQLPHDPHHEQLPLDSAQHDPRRVLITQQDITKYGPSPGCPKCGAYAQGHSQRAQCLKHTETCRERIYQRLRADSSPKIRIADEGGGARTRTTRPPPPTNASGQDAAEHAPALGHDHVAQDAAGLFPKAPGSSSASSTSTTANAPTATPPHTHTPST